MTNIPARVMVSFRFTVRTTAAPAPASLLPYGIEIPAPSLRFSLASRLAGIGPQNLYPPAPAEQSHDKLPASDASLFDSNSPATCASLVAALFGRPSISSGMVQVR